MARVRRLIKENLGTGMVYVNCDAYNRKQVEIEYWKRVDRAYKFIKGECEGDRDRMDDWSSWAEYVGDFE